MKIEQLELGQIIYIKYDQINIDYDEIHFYKIIKKTDKTIILQELKTKLVGQNEYLINVYKVKPADKFKNKKQIKKYIKKDMKEKVLNREYKYQIYNNENIEIYKLMNK